VLLRYVDDSFTYCHVYSFELFLIKNIIFNSLNRLACSLLEYKIIVASLKNNQFN
jgi:hypothetical protein